MDFVAQKMKYSIKDFFSKYDQICRKLWIPSHLWKTSGKILKGKLHFLCSIYYIIKVSFITLKTLSIFYKNEGSLQILEFYWFSFRKGI